ncbi:M50 family metallopeptidase [Cohnella nanjingensis]|uniref:M50 family metallopeptidase n=1 Tax=Cohnella nanjingensis TaxID=1387779 RepID=A0A7X0VI24_9BACL|nr:M50 family metallopeptidase [Cohnella nanjingensis]MBB6674755.1 M50 family metallopeptidase [Cohnella nanjingensis]
MNKWFLTILYLVVSVFLTRFIPFSSYFRNLDTMIHEFSHALVTLLVSGRVLRIELHADHSGVTYSMIPSSWGQLLVSMAGYVGASLFALLMFKLHSRQQQKLGLGLITGIALIMLLLYVHSGFGAYWLAGFIALNVFAFFVRPAFRNFYYLLLAFLSLEESAMGPFSLAMYAFEDSARAGDATNLQHYTGLPALVWSIGFTLFALWCATLALRIFSKEKGGRSASALSV